MDIQAFKHNCLSLEILVKTLVACCCQFNYFLFVGYLLFVCLLTLPSQCFAAPSQVGISTSSEATASSNSRKSFYDTLNNTHWVFWYDGTQIAYANSSDGSTWVSAGVLAYNTQNFTVTFKVVSGVSYMVLATVADSYDIVVRRGILSSSSIVFDSEVTAFNGTTISDAYSKPTIALDGNNNLWVGAVHVNDAVGFGRYQVKTVKSNNPITSQISQWDSVFNVSRRTDSISTITLIPQTNEKMYLIQSGDSGNVVGYIFDGSSWSSANTGGDYSWFSFGLSGVSGQYVEGIDSIVTDGSNIYVGGEFSSVGGIAVNNVAKWDGTSWSALGSGVNGSINAMVYANGCLYVCGSNFTTAGGVTANHIAKWDGTSWSALGSGFSTYSYVYALAAIGTDIYVGGEFGAAGGVSANYIAKWNGASWSALGSGLNARVRELTAVDTDLYVGGIFTTAGGVSANYIAKWDGSAWSALGSGVNAGVNAIAALGTDIYVGGQFTTAGGASANYIAKWDGSSWSTFGSGLYAGVEVEVGDIITINSDVYVCGLFTKVDGMPIINLAKWDGTSWSSVGSAANTGVGRLASVGGNLYASGNFTTIGGIYVNRIAKWDGSSWSALSPDINASVFAITRVGSDVYVGGSFTTIGGISANRIAKWDGSSWTALGAGLNNTVRALKVVDNILYVGGDFTTAGGLSAIRIAKWDLDSWSWNVVGTAGAGPNGGVHAIESLNGNVYVAGVFTNSGGVSTLAIAKWNGTTWSSVGSGSGEGIYALAVIGSDLYAGGEFTSIGGISANRIAKWDGSAWSTLGVGVNSNVAALLSVGSDLYVGGDFWTAGGLSINKVAKWDGSAWSGLGTGGPTDYVKALTIDSDNNIYAGDYYGDIGKWNGTTWSYIDAMNSGVNDIVRALAIVDSDLYIGGDFTTSYGATHNAAFLARWGLSPVANIGTNGDVSAVVESGNLHMVTKNAVGALVYRAYSASSSTWGSAVTLVASGAEQPSLSLDSSNGNLYVFWKTGNDVRYRKGVAPFAIANWTSVSSIYNIGTNQNVTAQINDGYGGIQLFWTNGSSNPYYIQSDIIAITHNISGTIRRNATGLSGVTVSAGVIGSATTDGSGVFSFANVPHLAPLTLTPSLSEHTFSPTNRIVNVVAYSSSEDFTALLNTYTISGTITDGTNPIQSVTIDGGALGTTTTASDGTYNFATISYGTNYSITVSKAGYTFGADSASGTLTTNTSHNFSGTLNTHTISGVINDGISPMPNVTVNGGMLGTTTTALDGSYQFLNIAYGTNYSIAALKTGYAFSTNPISGILTNDTTINFIALLNAHSISGVITDGTNPISGVVVTGGALGSKVTNSNGAFEFTNVPYGTTYTLLPSKTSYEFNPTSVSGTLQGATEHDFLGERNTYSISGVITSDSEPLSGVVVNGGALGSVITNSNGTYLFTNILSGTTYFISPSVNGYTLSPLVVSGTLSGNLTLNFTATATESTTAQLGGRVLKSDLEKTPLANVVVSTGTGQTSVTNENGEFIFENQEQGDYSLTGELDGYKITTASGTIATNKTDIELRATPVLPDTVYLPWNGYLGITNVLEIVNHGQDFLSTTISVIDQNGQQVSQLQASIAPNTQQDFIVNDMNGFLSNSYGLLSVQVSHNDYDARLSAYIGSLSATEHDAAYIIPANKALDSDSYAVVNTNVAGANASAVMLNWLSVCNVSAVKKTFEIVNYGIAGEQLTSQQVTIKPLNRIDISMNSGTSHELVHVRPLSPSTTYNATIYRYAMLAQVNEANVTSNIIHGATAIQLTSGNTKQYVAVSRGADGINWLELANTSDSRNTFEVEIKDPLGKLAGVKRGSLDAYEQVHILANDYLLSSSTGLAIISTERPSIAHSLNYYLDEFGSLDTFYAMPARVVYGASLVSSYNTYLGTFNWLKMINLTDSLQQATMQIELVNGATTNIGITLPPFGGLDRFVNKIVSDQMEFIGLTTYPMVGMVKIITEEPGSIFSETLRITPHANNIGIDIANSVSNR